MKYKIFSPDGELVARCKYPEEAAALVSVLDIGATVRRGNKNEIIWIEAEDNLAIESYDSAADAMRF